MIEINAICVKIIENHFFDLKVGKLNSQKITYLGLRNEHYHIIVSLVYVVYM